MNLSKEKLEEIRELAGLFLEPEEIAILLDIDPDQFLRQLRMKKGDIYFQYSRGKAESKRDIHTNVVKMAKHGSPQAEDLAQKMIINQERAEHATE